MRASLISLSLAIAAALLPAPPARATAFDHVHNGTFDDGAAGWSAIPSTSIDGEAIDGDARAVIASIGSTARVHQRIDGALDTGTYTISMIARANAPVDVTLRVEAFADPSLRLAFTERIDAEWRTIRGTFDIGAPTDARVIIDAAAAGSVALYADDVRLEGPPPVALTATPSATSTATAAPANPATITPPAGASPVATPASPTSTASATATPPADVISYDLRNAGFEDVTAESLPFAWDKYGGSLLSSTRSHNGARSAMLESATDSTKWLHQSVLIEGGAWYAFSGWILHDDPAVAAAFLRVSWYESADATGSALSTSDSRDRLNAPSPAWRLVETGSVMAPLQARSARVRFMLAPRGGEPASILVDDASFASAPPAPPSAAIPMLAAAPAGADGDPANDASPRRISQARGRAVRAAASGGPTAARVVINEVLYDASGDGADADGEWVELYNAGAEPVDLAGWSLADEASRDLLPAIVVPARGFVIIAASDSIGAAVASSGARASTVSGRIGNGLGNDGDTLYLIDKSGALVDAVSWGNAIAVLDAPVPDVPEGHSIERTTPGTDSDHASDWADNASPTPGRPYERPAAPAGGPPSGRRIEVATAGDAFDWVPWAAMGLSTAALAATLAWRTIDEVRARRPQP